MAEYKLSNQDIIKGSHLMVFMEGEPIAFATSHSLSKTLNTQEVTTKDHGDSTAILPTTTSWQVTCENLYSLNGYQKVNYAFRNKKEVEIYFGETTYNQTANQESIVGKTATSTMVYNWEPTGYGEKGKALITQLDVTAAAGENATFTATFTGSGELEEVANYDVTSTTTAKPSWVPTGTEYPMPTPTGVLRPEGVQEPYDEVAPSN